MINVSNNIKLCIAIFFIFYLNYTAAMQLPQLNQNLLHKISEFSTLRDANRLRQATKPLYHNFNNNVKDFMTKRYPIGKQHYEDITKFMHSRHNDNWTCKESDDEYPNYECQSMIRNTKMNFNGHPGFELSKYGNIKGPILGQGEKKKIDKSMEIRNINMEYPELYATNHNQLLETLTKYWKTNKTNYGLEFHYIIGERTANTLFRDEKDLGLENIYVYGNYPEVQRMVHQYYHYDKREDKATVDIKPGDAATYDHQETIYYTFSFEESKYYPQSQNNTPTVKNDPKRANNGKCNIV
jgi:hypothetical protein